MSADTQPRPRGVVLTWYECSVCSDGKGFWVRPCVGCGRQKGADIARAKVYHVHVGERVTAAHLEALREEEIQDENSESIR